MTKPTPLADARTDSLHPRLTVALAAAPQRERALAVLLDLGPSGARRLSAEDLAGAAAEIAEQHAPERDARRAHLDGVAARIMHDCDTAQSRLQHLEGWKRTLKDGAQWARELHEDLHSHLRAVDAAREELDDRRTIQRAAEQALERVMEQRTAVVAAIEEADRELEDVSDWGMDESELRRQLESAGQANREAQEACAAAEARVEALRVEWSDLVARARAAGAPLAEAPMGGGRASEEAIDAVAEALSGLQSVFLSTRPDPEALALVEAWLAVERELAAVADEDEGPGVAAIEAARVRVAAADRALAQIEAEVAAAAVSPSQLAAIDAAHRAVTEAEEQLERRVVPPGARKRLDRARELERELLDRHGFGSHLDVVLSGGRSTAAAAGRVDAERVLLEATRELEALERAAASTPGRADFERERDHLARRITDLLLVDPGSDPVGLLRAHRPMPRHLQESLAEALQAAGVRPIGISLEDAAVLFLEAHRVDASEPDEPWSLASEERSAVQARAKQIEIELADALAEVDQAAESLQDAQRSIASFEGELTVRAGDDEGQRMQRFAAAEQLRVQVEAAAKTLRRAEDAARAELSGCIEAVGAAEAAYDEAEAAVDALSAQARTLAEELPIDQRPSGNPLQSLPQLAERLSTHAGVLQPEIDEAAAAAEEASSQLEEALEEARQAAVEAEAPTPDDHEAGLRALLDEAGSDVLILDEPFSRLAPALRTRLLDLVVDSSEQHKVVLLTEDPEVLGWAIELPADVAAAVPVDALLARATRQNQDLPAPAIADSMTTTDETDTDPAPKARWAGRR